MSGVVTCGFSCDFMRDAIVLMIVRSAMNYAPVSSPYTANILLNILPKSSILTAAKILPLEYEMSLKPLPDGVYLIVDCTDHFFSVLYLLHFPVL